MQYGLGQLLQMTSRLVDEFTSSVANDGMKEAVAGSVT